jgi:signal transduction histidine kinase
MPSNLQSRENSAGSIYVTIEKKKNTENGNKKEVIVSIKDTGKGIDSEIMPRLFRKFATKSETGTGLGLFICKSVIEVHGGKIWAENNTNGNGATFTFSLPVSQQQQEQGRLSPSSKLTSQKRGM